jgi:hypothetical protein
MNADAVKPTREKFDYRNDYDLPGGGIILDLEFMVNPLATPDEKERQIDAAYAEYSRAWDDAERESAADPAAAP